ncbi:PREDICTED: uncharacterized protein LOC108568023 [Nicrophorus vespilloides]|uniref:Uncharacterized protein LOC108568023 n=1 Tax=Nicrophorus vespilloides TaxID=110193 RepID=A0ABM1NC08_NICVS|nr:PREDICTED: uncharacterized protein LOC108568023 [Nicrophorus vespilloides]
MFLVPLIATILVLVRVTQAYVFPICQETGKALNAVLSSLRSLIPNCMKLLTTRPKPLPEPTYWQKIGKLVGYEKVIVEDSNIEPCFCNNGVVVLVALILMCLYILFIKKYFVTVKDPRPQFIPFMSNEEDGFDTEVAYEQSIRARPTMSCTRCGCLSYDRGDA